MFGPHTEKVFSIQSIAIIKSDYGVYQFVFVCVFSYHNECNLLDLIGTFNSAPRQSSLCGAPQR